MRVWIVAFVVVFAGVELFQWVLQLGTWHPSGVVLILGGMGLAAVSNWSQLTGTQPDETALADQSVGASATEESAEGAIASNPSSPAAPVSSSNSNPEDDNISFKIRPLKR